MTAGLRLSSKPFRLALGVALVLLGSCGGRTLSGPHADAAAVNQGDDASGAAGHEPTTGAAGSSAGHGGAAGSTGTGAAGSGSAGATGGGSGNAGATGAAGAGAAGRGGTGGSAGSTGTTCGPCPSPDCLPGYASVHDPAVSCCPICRPVKCPATCSPPPCPAGSHLEMLDGQCCPTCQPGTESNACRTGRASYTQLRAALVEKYNSSGCMTDTDCTLVFEDNACVSNCGTAFPVSLASNAESNLKSAAQMDCGTCARPDRPPCALLVALCSNGHCTAAFGP
jgi:hypothetical protein